MIKIIGIIAFILVVLYFVNGFYEMYKTYKDDEQKGKTLHF